MRQSRRRVLVDGLVAGLIGYAIVLILLALVDLVQGRPALYTPALLGEVLFYGARTRAEVEVWAGPILAYNGFHLAAFLVFGAFAAWLALQAERGPHFWYIAVITFLFVVLHIAAALLVLPEPIQSAVPAWEFFLATFSGAVAMAAYLLWRHPRLPVQSTD